MSLNLIDLAKNLFTNELISKASNALGESENGIAKAVSGLVPTIFSSIAQKAGSSDGLASVASAVQQQHSGGILEKVGGFFSGDDSSSTLLKSGGALASSLLGDKFDGVTSLISKFAGIKESSSNGLMSMAMPSLLGLIGKHSNGGNASDLSSLLKSQAGNFSAAIPSGFNFSSLLGGLAGGLTGAATAAATAGVKNISSAASNYTNEVEKKSGLLWPLLIGAALLIGGWFLFSKGCNNGTTASTGTDTTSTSPMDKITDVATAVAGKFDSLKNEFVYDGGKMVAIDLPNGAGKLDVGEFSTEYKLFSFLSDANSVVDTVKGNWFEFTNVKFKTGSSEITEESLSQLKNMVAISKAFPTATFKIGGYTDNTGDSTKNVQLSDTRAETVAKQLVKFGAATASIAGSKGFGSQYPVATNDTPEGRAQNRRVAVNVKSK